MALSTADFRGPEVILIKIFPQWTTSQWSPRHNLVGYQHTRGKSIRIA